MNISKRRWNSYLWAGVCLAAQLLLFPTLAVGQDSCLGLPPPDTNLYLIPDRVLYSYDFTANGLAAIHDYGKASLAFLSDVDGVPPDVLSQITEISDPASISFRNFSRQFVTSASVNGEMVKDGVSLVAMFGPLDARILDLLRSSGILILESAPPYGILVKADVTAMERALKLCTSEGYRLIRSVFTLPIEARLNPILLKTAEGEGVDLSATNLVYTEDGGIVARISAFEDGRQEETMAQLSAYFQKPAPDMAHGYEDAYIVRPDQAISILNAVPGIAYIEPLSEPAPSANIAMRGEILNIEPVWNSLGYTGKDVTILLNDLGGVDITHKDLCTIDPDPTDSGATCPSPASIVKIAYGGMTNVANAHGTHVAGSLAGRGWNVFDYNNYSLCRPWPEEGGPNPQDNCGENSNHSPRVKGAAPDAFLVANNIKSSDGESDIILMMRRGYIEGGARISNNSWWDEPIDGTPDSYGDYEQKAIDVDSATRDAVPNSEMAGNQQMLIVFAAGNNDQLFEQPDTDPNGWVKGPATAKNIISVGATENPRCGYARHYELGYANAENATRTASGLCI